MVEKNSLSPKQARKLVLLSQGVHRPTSFGRGDKGTLAAIEQLGYVQIDTISVVERAHHHTLWNRNSSYKPTHLDQLVGGGQVFEYWSHAAAYLPMRDFRYSLPVKQSFLDGRQHWYTPDPKVMASVIERIAAEGPLQARDFDEKERSVDRGWGGRKPSKIALEQLFMQGDLMISGRKGFQKIYDLSERVVPSGVAQSMPPIEDYSEYLVHSFLGANGIGTPSEMAYLRKGLRLEVAKACKHMLEDNRLIELSVGGSEYYALPKALEALSSPLSKTKLAILSPFDNVLIQRKRTAQLFGFEYLIECYVTAAKRKYGYFSLPLLWGDKFAGRMDCKVDRKSGVLHIKNLSIETAKFESLLGALVKALAKFKNFNQASDIKLERVSTTIENLPEQHLFEVSKRYLIGD